LLGCSGKPAYSARDGSFGFFSFFGFTCLTIFDKELFFNFFFLSFLTTFFVALLVAFLITFFATFLTFFAILFGRFDFYVDLDLLPATFSFNTFPISFQR